MNLREHIARYCKYVIDTESQFCEKYRWSALRFLNDLSRENTSSFPYIFNPQIYNHKGSDFGPAERYVDRWMPLFKHTKGPLAGQSKIAVDYERFVYGNIYGWVDRDTGMRRFRRMYEQLARKNAKSQDKAIQGIYECSAFGEPLAEVYVAATKKEQTRHVWGEAKRIIENSILKDSFTCKYDQELQNVVIRHKASGSFFARMSKDDKKTGDGANPQFVVLDEYHLHDTTEYYDLATSGMKTRTQPLLSIITTAGFDLNNPCYRVEYDYVSKILNPNSSIENEAYFAAICELETNQTPDPIEINGRKVNPGEVIDDITDSKVWVKANPIIGTSEVGIKSIEIDVKEANDKPEKMRDVLTKTFNIWVNQREAGFMNIGRWAACKGDLPDFNGLSCIVGYDISAYTDLTSVAFEFCIGGVYYVMQHSFVPSEKVDEKESTDRVPYRKWEKDGHVTIIPGAGIDYRYIRDYIIETPKQNGWNVKEVAGDPAYASQIAGELLELGYTCVDVRQGPFTLSAPTKDFRAQVYNKNVIHSGDPLLTWSIGNAIVQTDRNDNFLLSKSKSSNRIDPVAAIINAHCRWLKHEPEPLYATTGYRSLYD